MRDAAGVSEMKIKRRTQLNRLKKLAQKKWNKTSVLKSFKILQKVFVFVELIEYSFSCFI